MILGDFSHCKDLGEFYIEISKLHEKKHGDEYTLVHDALIEYSNKLCGGIYKEIGVMQGATLALMVTQSCMDKFIAIDKDLSRFKPYEKLFHHYLIDFGDFQSLKYFECDSFSQEATTECDLLYLDSCHTKKHVAKELKYHSPYVTSTIIIHDTEKDNLYTVVEDFVLTSKGEWYIEERCKDNVGYMVIKRYTGDD